MQLKKFLRGFLSPRTRRRRAGITETERTTKNIGKSRIQIGRFTYGAGGIVIREWGEGASLSIGDFCSIAPNLTVFLGGNHRTDWITTFPFGESLFNDAFGYLDITGHPSSNGDVKIGNDVWIGYNATIMSGVTIGDGAVVAANSHVVRDVSAYEIVGGNPSQHIRYRFDEEIRHLLMQLKWWELSVEEVTKICRELSSPPSVASVRALLDRLGK